jgi:periplasmic protein TonB
MFEQAFVVGTGRTRRPWTVPLSFAGELAVAGILVLMPLIFTEKLPRARLMPRPMSAPLMKGVANPQRGTVVEVVAVVRERKTGLFVLPRVPSRISLPMPEAPAIEEGPVAAACIGPCGPAGDPNGVPWGVPPLGTEKAIPPAPPVVRAPEPVRTAAARPAQPARIKVGGVVQEAKLISKPAPVYPTLAVRTRATGVVRLAAVIGTDGRIRELRSLGGHPMLVTAAMDAVRRWVYRPTLLNGEPVEVDTEITVVFSLGGS